MITVSGGAVVSIVGAEGVIDTGVTDGGAAVASGVIGAGVVAVVILVAGVVVEDTVVSVGGPATSEIFPLIITS